MDDKTNPFDLIRASLMSMITPIAINAQQRKLSLLMKKDQLVQTVYYFQKSFPLINLLLQVPSNTSIVTNNTSQGLRGKVLGINNETCRLAEHNDLFILSTDTLMSSLKIVGCILKTVDPGIVMDCTRYTPSVLMETFREYRNLKEK